MKEETLFKIALIGILIGLPILFYFSENLEVTKKDIFKINLGDIDSDLKVSGVVSKVKSLGNITIIEITQPKTIPILVFDNLSIPEGTRIDAFGRVTEYQGEPQIIADIIRHPKG